MFSRDHQRLSKPGETLAGLAHFVSDLATSDVFLRWLLVVGVGVFLGTYAIGATFLPMKAMALVTVGIVALFGMMVIGNMRRVLLAAIILDAPIQLDANLFYRDDAAALGALGGLTISFTTLALIGLYSLWLADLLSRHVKDEHQWLKLIWAPLLYTVMTGLSTAFAYDKQLSLFEFGLVVQFLLVHIYVIGNTRTRQDVLFLMTVLMSVVILESLLMIMVRGIGHPIQAGSLMIRVEPSGRVGGTVGSPINAASYLTLVLAPILGVWIMPLSRFYKWLSGIAFVLGGIALILTLSRAAWAGTLLSVGTLSVLAWRRGWLDVKIILFTILIIIILIITFQGMIVDRLTTDDGGSASARLPLMKIAWRIIKDHPVGGVGANNIPMIIRNYSTPDLGTNVWLYSIHNKYLLVWAEQGPIALFAFLAFLLITLWRGWQVWFTNDHFLSPLALGFTVAMMGSMLHMFVDVFRSRPEIQTLWVNAGLLAAMRYNNITHRERP